MAHFDSEDNTVINKIVMIIDHHHRAGYYISITMAYHHYGERETPAWKEKQEDSSSRAFPSIDKSAVEVLSCFSSAEATWRKVRNRRGPLL